MTMRKDDGWRMPRRTPITRKEVDRALAAEAARAAHEHHARAVWYDLAHDAVVLLLRDGRVFGAERARIPSLAEATPRQCRTLQVTEDGALLVSPACDLHGLVTRLLEGSPAALRRSAARSAGATTSAAKTAAARRTGASVVGRGRRRRFANVDLSSACCQYCCNKAARDRSCTADSSTR
jgi:hypothetical protein